jgi:hypothetical protein
VDSGEDEKAKRALGRVLSLNEHDCREDLMGVRLITYYTAYAAGPGLRRSRTVFPIIRGLILYMYSIRHVLAALIVSASDDD